MQTQTVNRLGFWSILLASVFSITYIIGQLAEWLNLLGSGGGPENAHLREVAPRGNVQDYHSRRRNDGSP